MKIVLATRNRDKVAEITQILAGLDVALVTLDDYPDAPVTVEDGSTLDENALKKAREIRDHTGETAMADDTGLEVDALDGAPGIYAARYAGEDATYADNVNKLVTSLDGVPREERGAKFRCVIAIALSPAHASRLGANTEALVAEGILPGEIATAPRGQGGFGYDPVFIDPRAGKSLAEMTSEEKNTTSHRYRALVEMRELLLREGLASESEV